MNNFQAFTIDYNGFTKLLYVEIFIKQSSLENIMEIPQPCEQDKFSGIIDTGASTTAISKELAEKLNLPIGVIYQCRYWEWSYELKLSLF